MRPKLQIVFGIFLAYRNSGTFHIPLKISALKHTKSAYSYKNKHIYTNLVLPQDTYRPPHLAGTAGWATASFIKPSPFQTAQLCNWECCCPPGQSPHGNSFPTPARNRQGASRPLLCCRKSIGELRRGHLAPYTGPDNASVLLHAINLAPCCTSRSTGIPPLGHFFRCKHPTNGIRTVK